MAYSTSYYNIFESLYLNIACYRTASDVKICVEQFFAGDRDQEGVCGHKKKYGLSMTGNK